MKKIVLDKGWMAVCLFLTGSSLALGQWQTQSLELKPGWNGVYMHVDSTHSGIAALASGTLVAFQLDHPPLELGGLHVLFALDRRLPLKVRAMIDYLVEVFENSPCGPS